MLIEKIDRGISLKSQDNNDEFLIHFGGADLYFTMNNYYNENKFIITKEDYIYFMINEMFSIAQKEKKPWNDIFENNSLIWYSESYGTKENANRLIITKDNDAFIIKFYLNKNSYMANRNICPVSFCLSGSEFPNISNYLAITLNQIMRDEFNRVLSK